MSIRIDYAPMNNAPTTAESAGGRMKAEYTEHIYQEYHCTTYEPLHQREEIVRCRDCKHYEYWEFRDGRIAHDCARDGDYLFDTEPNGFCSWGERRGA